MNLIFKVNRHARVATESAAFPSLMIPAGSSSLRLFPESYIYWKGYLTGDSKIQLFFVSFCLHVKALPAEPLNCGHSFLMCPSLPQIKQRFSLKSLSSCLFHFSAGGLRSLSLPRSPAALTGLAF